MKLSGIAAGLVPPSSQSNEVGAPSRQHNVCIWRDGQTPEEVGQIGRYRILDTIAYRDDDMALQSR